MRVADLLETPVRDDVVVWTPGGETIHTSYGTNCVAVIGRDGVLLVDPLVAPAYARAVERRLRERTDAPVRFVVLTHHHTDHTLGAAWFAGQGAVVCCHRACAERMAAEHPARIAARRADPPLAELFADADPVVPSLLIDETVTVRIDGRDVEVWHPGWGHTPGDLFVYLADAGVAICGDLVFHGYHFNYEDASPDGARRGLEALRALDADTFIPGHGQVGGPELLDAQAAYHETVEAAVRNGVAAGQDDAAIAADVRARFPDYLLTVVAGSGVELFGHRR